MYFTLQRLLYQIVVLVSTRREINSCGVQVRGLHVASGYVSNPLCDDISYVLVFTPVSKRRRDSFSTELLVTYAFSIDFDSLSRAGARARTLPSFKCFPLISLLLGGYEWVSVSD